MSRKLIHVTQEDIDKGVRGSSNSCPIARAIKRETDMVNFKVLTWALYNYQHEIICSFSDKTSSFILEYDLGRRVKPFNFYLKEVK